MSDNPAARAARNEALRRHRRHIIAHRILIAAIALGWASSEVHRYLSRPTPTKWVEGRAPALQPFYVVTKGYTDKKGKWRSFTNGEKIDVYHWLSEEQ